jgi:hypothetical protein
MKTLIMLAVGSALAGTGYAQIMTTLPPTAPIPIQSIGLSAGATHWDSAGAMASFKIDGLTEGNNRITSLIYNPLGLSFSSSIPASLQASLNSLNTNGGSIRTIFISESAGWTDSLGYTFTGNMAGPQSYTAFAQMQDTATSGTSANIKFGDYFDVNLAVGAAAKFDLWFQGQDALNGADYTLFHPANGSSTVAPGNALWAQLAVTENTWIPSKNAYMDVSTYIVGLEDWRLDRQADADYSDTILALQFFTDSGAPITPPVPEPSTYGLIGAVALLGLVAVRKYTRKVRNH